MDVEHAGRFVVEHEEIGLADQRPHDREPLALPAGQPTATHAERRVEAGRAAARSRPRRGRRPRRADEQHARRRVPEVLGLRRGLHPGALLRTRPAAAQARRAPHRRRPDPAPPGRPRLPQGLRRLQGRHGVHRARRRSSSSKRSRAGPWAPASRPATSPTRRRSCPRPSCGSSATGSSCRSPTPPSRSARTTTRVRSRPRSSTSASGGPRSVARSRSGSSATRRCPPGAAVDAEFAAGVRHPGLDDDGLHPAAPEPHPRPGRRAADRADHPGRGPHVRHGPAVQGGRHLRLAGPALRAGRLGSRAQLPRGDRRPGPRGGHHRGRLDGQPPGRRDRRTRATAWR